MFMFAGLLTIMSMFFEYELVKRIKAVKWLLVHCHPIVGLVFSCVLSVFLGSIFGAEGLTVMFAGVASTILMQPIYAMMRSGTWDPTMRGARVAAKIILFPIWLLGKIVIRTDKTVAKVKR